MSTTIGSKKKVSASTSGKSKSTRAKKGQKSLKSNRPSSAKQGSPTPEDWALWTQHLATRAVPEDIKTISKHGKTTPLLWALPDDLAGSPTERLIEELSSLGSKKKIDSAKSAQLLEPWLLTTDHSSASPAYGLECLAWCHSLPWLASALPAAPWSQLLEHLIETAGQASGIDSQSDPLAHQLLTGELPFTLSYLFPELKECTRLTSRAVQNLSSVLKELNDGEGVFQSVHLTNFRPLFACWTRCGLIAASTKSNKAAKSKAFDRDAFSQYEWLVRRGLQFTRRDGRQVFSSGSAGAWDRAMFETALDLSDDQIDDTIAKVSTPLRKKIDDDFSEEDLPASSFYSEWAELALLRSVWSRGSEQVAVTFGERSFQSELLCGSNVLWSGACDPEVTINGQRLTPQSDWEEVCWFSDEDVDYLELECTLSDNWNLQRQITLAREERFFYVADALLGKEEADISYRCQYPLAPTTTFKGAKETHEGFLYCNKKVAQVIPLALPEWKNAEPIGSLGMNENHLVLNQTARGRSLYAPLFVDLHPRRMNKKLTWRRLTVAENLEIQPAEVAVGYRIQIDKEQWMIYRSLAPVGNRTLLGQNLSCEFHLGCFDIDGKAEELIEIE